MDANREIRAMILTALPYPPLPMVVRKIEDTTLTEEKIVTSHDVISQLIEAHGRRNDRVEAAKRQERQRDVLRCFLAELVRDGLQQPPALYETYCKYTRLHIGTYFPEGTTPPSVFFQPLDRTCKGDRVHLRTCDYMAGQAQLLELLGGLASQDWLHRDYVELLLECRGRLVCEGKDDRQLEEERRERERMAELD